MNDSHPVVLRHFVDLASKWKHGALSIGNFDGVHRGHRALIRQLVEQAHRVGGPAIVFTFDPHPAKILRPSAAPTPLTWVERRAELLGQLGVDAVIAYPTDHQLLNLTAQEFFDQLVVQSLMVRTMVEGPNFYFGKGRTGDVELLEEFCRAREIDLFVVEPETEADGGLVSSSLIRQEISAGNVEQASTLLLSPYRIRGVVVAGEARGRQLGFPTANLADIATLVPGAGVYAATATVEGTRYPAAVNVGPNPTFSEAHHKVEVHLIGFTGNLYEQVLEVDFLTRLRDIQTFDSVASLREQLDKDVAMAKAVADEKQS